MKLASIKLRALAKVIDIFFIVSLYLLNVLLASILSVLLVVILPIFGFYTVNNYLLPIKIISYSVEVFSFLIYFSYFVSKYEGTIGKKICRIKIATTNEKKLTPYRAFCRFIAELLSAALFGFGYILALFDSEKRALHDRICSTRVVIAEAKKSKKSNSRDSIFNYCSGQVRSLNLSNAVAVVLYEALRQTGQLHD